MTTALQIDSVSKIYPSAGSSMRAVDMVSAAIEAGEFVAPVGPSGSGKTTLLQRFQPPGERVGLECQHMRDQAIRQVHATPEPRLRTCRRCASRRIAFLFPYDYDCSITVLGPLDRNCSLAQESGG